MSSLRALLALHPTTLYPAHGPHIPSISSSRSKLEQYLSHRQQREDQILKLLDRAHYDGEGLTIPDLVERIYANENLPERAMFAAEKSVEAHLKKLETEVKAKRLDGEVWALA